MKHSNKLFIFGRDAGGSLLPAHVDGLPSVTLSQLIGDSLATLMCADDSIDGLQLVRLRLGSSTIVAHKRFNDVKVIVSTYE